MSLLKSTSLLLGSSVFLGTLFLGACATVEQPVQPWQRILEVARIAPPEAYEEVESGKALLVCAYSDEEICRKMLLKGAISLRAFESRLPGLRKDQPIIFYCG